MCIGARTSHGKSAFAINMTKWLADKSQTIAYFSLEMNSEQLVERLMSNFSEIDNRALREGKATVEVEAKEGMFLSWLEDMKLLIDDQYGYNFNNIVEIVENIKPDFVIIDYIQMISTQGYRSKLDAIEEYIRKLKQLSLEYNFGAIVLSQLNRTAEGDPSMSKLKWAGVLEEHSDTVILLNWKWEVNEFHINIAKQRHGECGSTVVKFKPEFSKFIDDDK